MQISVKLPSSSNPVYVNIPDTANFRLQPLYVVTAPDLGGGYSDIVEKIFETENEAKLYIAGAPKGSYLNPTARLEHYFVTTCNLAGDTRKIAAPFKGGSHGFFLVGDVTVSAILPVLSKLSEAELKLLEKHFRTK